MRKKLRPLQPLVSDVVLASNHVFNLSAIYFQKLVVHHLAKSLVPKEIYVASTNNVVKITFAVPTNVIEEDVFLEQPLLPSLPKNLMKSPKRTKRKKQRLRKPHQVTPGKV